MSVRPVTTRRDHKRFIDFQYDLYRGDYPYFVPPLRSEVSDALDRKKNPFFEHSTMQQFLATDAQGEVVGRIAAIENGNHLAKHGDGAGFFGFFECVEDEAVAAELVEAASEWLRERGLTSMRGPANPSLNDTAGLLVDGYDREPSILMPYNPPYYQKMLAGLGFETVMTMWAYYLHKKYVQIDKLERGTRILMRRNPDLSIRELRMDELMEEAHRVRAIYNDAWADNWGHVPMTEHELEHMVESLKQIVEPNMVFFLEDAGEPVAFSLTLPNLNQALKHIKDGRLFPLGLPKLLAYSQFGGIYEVRMPLMGVRQSHQGRGLFAPLVYQTIKNGIATGYDACEMSWVLDNNKVLINALDDMGGVRDKEYAMLEKQL